MGDEDRARSGLIAAIVVLLVALVVIFVLWQRDRESKDLEIDVDTGGAGALVDPGATLARRPPGAYRLEEG